MGWGSVVERIYGKGGFLSLEWKKLGVMDGESCGDETEERRWVEWEEYED